MNVTYYAHGSSGVSVQMHLEDFIIYFSPQQSLIFSPSVLVNVASYYGEMNHGFETVKGRLITQKHLKRSSKHESK